MIHNFLLEARNSKLKNNTLRPKFETQVLANAILIVGLVSGFEFSWLGMILLR
jgi:hypothetical protein